MPLVPFRPKRLGGLRVRAGGRGETEPPIAHQGEACLAPYESHTCLHGGCAEPATADQARERADETPVATKRPASAQVDCLDSRLGRQHTATRGRNRPQVGRDPHHAGRRVGERHDAARWPPRRSRGAEDDLVGFPGENLEAHPREELFDRRRGWQPAQAEEHSHDPVGRSRDAQSSFDRPRWIARQRELVALAHVEVRQDEIEGTHDVHATGTGAADGVRPTPTRPQPIPVD